MVRALDFYPGGPGSNPIWDVGFFQAMHHFLVTNFHIRKTPFDALCFECCVIVLSDSLISLYINFQIPDYLGTEWVGRRLLDKKIPELSVWSFETIRDGTKVTMVILSTFPLRKHAHMIYSNFFRSKIDNFQRNFFSSPEPLGSQGELIGWP